MLEKMLKKAFEMDRRYLDWYVCWWCNSRQEWWVPVSDSGRVVEPVCHYCGKRNRIKTNKITDKKIVV